MFRQARRLESLKIIGRIECYAKSILFNILTKRSRAFYSVVLKVTRRLIMLAKSEVIAQLEDSKHLTNCSEAHSQTTFESEERGYLFRK